MKLDAVAEHPWVTGEDGPIPQYLCWCKRNSSQRDQADGSKNDTSMNNTESDGSKTNTYVTHND